MTAVSRGSRRLIAAFAFLALLIGPSVAADDGEFGAIAFDKVGAYGWSSDYGDEAMATQRAMDECKKNSPQPATCALVRTFRNTCVTMARNEIRGKAHITWAEGQTKAARADQTMSECKRFGGSACKILKEFCTGSATDG